MPGTDNAEAGPHRFVSEARLEYIESMGTGIVSGSVPTRAATGRCWANTQLRPALSPNATLDETEGLRGQAVRTRSMNSSLVPHSISASVTLSMCSEPDTASRSADSWPAVSSPNFLAMIRRRTKA